MATFSLDRGITLNSHVENIEAGPENRTHVVVTSPVDRGEVFAARGTGVYASNNGGCTWRRVFDAPEPLQLVAPRYFGIHGVGPRGDTLYFFWESGLRRTYDLPFQAIDFSASLQGMAYALTADARIMRKRWTTEGEWDHVAIAPSSSNPRYLSVSPSSIPINPQHLVLAMESGPPMVTVDDGVTWTESAGVLQGADSVTTSRVYFSGTRTPLAFINELWVHVVRERTNPGTGDIVEERAIARSTDGGLTFSDVVVEDGVDIVLRGEVQMATSRNAAGELLFAAGGCPDGEPRLYHYRAEDDSVTVIRWEGSDLLGIGSLHFQPLVSPRDTDEDILYIGLSSVGTCD